MPGQVFDPSLVPSQIPAALTERVITTAGEDGYSGGYGGSPTSGRSGGNISVRLHYDRHKQSNIQVVDGRNYLTEISRHEHLLLNARGGHGGNGGIGLNGHNGSRGYDGQDATRYSAGTDGGRGGDGGDAGPGTHGANAGHGGHVSLTLAEKDLDLLLAINWKINGGTGGTAGQHGIPGTGGSGGRGGSSYSWTEYRTETYTDQDGNQQSRQIPIRHTNPGGRDGANGRNGRRPTSILLAGSDGRNGSARINIEDRSGSAKTYVNRYHLVVKSFEVVDENNDGINEPGEYLIVKNIIVDNQGAMPSPSGNLIKVVIRNSRWLEPETSAPLNIPNSILPGHQAKIPGQLRALIRHEQTQRKSGQQLLDNDTVMLLAYSERLRRAVPEFSGAVPISIQYPLQLMSPAYMNCMTKADEMEISWIVKNISSRGYGHSSDTGRATTTRLIDSKRSFVLESAVAGTNLAIKDIDHSYPKTESGISESFTVASETLVFSTGTLRLELRLSDPHDPGKLREIMNYEVDIQVSEGYEYRENSQFLLVINASAKNEAILEMKSLIISELHLGVDIFNLSLTGTLADDETQKSVLLNYAGKSIIITGDAFRYFGSGTRYNWDLMDPQEVLLLSMKHTGFLFCGVIDDAQNDLTKWSTMLNYPVGPDVDNTSTLVSHKDGRTLVKSLHNDDRSDCFNLELKNQYLLNEDYRTLRRIFRRTTDKRLKKNGKSLEWKLNSQMPTRRFVVTSEKRSEQLEEAIEKPVQENVQEPVVGEKDPFSVIVKLRKERGSGKRKQRSKKDAPSTGIIIVAEGLSRTAHCVVSHSPIIDDHNTITSRQVMMMIASLPFRNLALIFWNMVRSISRKGLSAEAFYRNLPDFQHSLDSSRIDDYENESSLWISHDTCIAVAWAVEHVLKSDFQHLSAKYNPRNIRRSDTAKKENAHIHTHRISQFFIALPEDSISASDEGVELAVEVLGSLNAAIKSPNMIVEILRSLPGFQSKLRRKFAKHKKCSLLFMAPREKVKQLEKRVSERTKQLSRELRNNNTQPTTETTRTQRKLSNLNQGLSFEYTDISAGKDGSRYLDPIDFQKYKNRHRELIYRQWSDTAYAREMRNAMIARVYNKVNYMPLADFK